MAKILIVDDDETLCGMLSEMSASLGHSPVCAPTLREGLKEASAGAYDVVFLDVRLPDGNGLDHLSEFRNASSHPEVIIMTGMGDPDGAELAVKSGAWDYVEKPASLTNLMLPLMRALQYREEKKALKPRVALDHSGIIGKSPQMKACLGLLAQAAAGEASVLITGETGTGKELFAWAIHNNSSRAGKNFVVVDCAALPDTLVESTLFGHEKGAFTGADRRQEGLIKQADGGTLFLDEVGELPLSLQRAFLRVLQEHRFRPVGGKKEVESEFRLVAATNRNLDGMVAAGQFRKDLLFRLRSLTIELPLLKGRSEDIMELAIFQMTKICGRLETGIKGFFPEFIEALTSYEWPGNVRELFQTMESAISTARYEPTLFPKHLPNHIRIPLARRSIHEGSSEKEEPRGDPAFPSIREIRDSIVELEKRYLIDLLNHTQGDIPKACEVAGLRRSRFYELLKKHKIPS
jgi:two-component system NtrC family response regulator